jgi:glucose-6-phosphate 1-epimerase
MDIQTLTDNFAITGVLAFDATEGGLIRARVTVPSCTAEFYLQGGHLALWQPVGHGPALFLSEQSLFVPGKAIRGGIPIIFPWFGARSAELTGARTDGPSHGFARSEQWELAFAALSGDDLHITLTLAPSETSRALGFDNFKLAYSMVLGETLKLSLTVANEADAPLKFEEAFHTYFAVGDTTKVGITGLAGIEYLDKTDHFLRKRQTDPVVTYTSETDRPYLNTEATVVLEDPTLSRRITVAKQGSQTTVIWNPWIELSAKLADMADDGWRRMACIETANAADNAITLAPGATHTMECRISIESL